MTSGGALTTVAIPKDYGYVVSIAAATCLLSFWHGIRVGGFRKAAGIAYPQPYADSANMSAASANAKKKMYLFNCAQRAHGNYIENHAPFVVAMLLSGVEYPRSAAVMGVGWMVGRIIYAVGYTREDKDKGQGRLAGSMFWLFQLGAIGLTAYSGIKMVM